VRIITQRSAITVEIESVSCILSNTSSMRLLHVHMVRTEHTTTSYSTCRFLSLHQCRCVQCVFIVNLITVILAISVSHIYRFGHRHSYCDNQPAHFSFLQHRSSLCCSIIAGRHCRCSASYTKPVFYSTFHIL